MHKEKNPPPINPLLEEAERLYDAEEYAKVIALCMPHIHSNDALLAHDANRIAGLSNFRLGSYKEAYTLLEEVVKHKVLAGDWFNLSTTAVLVGDVERGKEALEKEIEFQKQNNEDESLARILFFRFHFMGILVTAEKYADAWDLCKAMASSYTYTGVTDLTHLFLSYGSMQIPSFGSYLDVAEKILPHIDKEEAKKWLDALEEKIDGEGKRQVEKVRNTVFA